MPLLVLLFIPSLVDSDTPLVSPIEVLELSLVLDDLATEWFTPYESDVAKNAETPETPAPPPAVKVLL